MKLKTCCKCPHLKFNEVMDTPIHYCGQTKLIVPRQFNRVGTELQFAFTRVPMRCPLSKEEVVKSKVSIPEAEWELVKIEGAKNG